MKKERDSLLTSSISVFALQKRQLPLFAPTDFPRERFDRWTSLASSYLGKGEFTRKEIKQRTAKKQLEGQSMGSAGKKAGADGDGRLSRKMAVVNSLG